MKRWVRPILLSNQRALKGSRLNAMCDWWISKSVLRSYFNFKETICLFESLKQFWWETFLTLFLDASFVVNADKCYCIQTFMAQVYPKNSFLRVWLSNFSLHNKTPVLVTLINKAWPLWLLSFVWLTAVNNPFLTSNDFESEDCCSS